VKFWEWSAWAWSGWDESAIWLVVAITLAAVLVALFEPRLQARLWAPRVTVIGNVLPVNALVDDDYESRVYVRLRLEAGRKRPAAKDVSVLLLSCSPPAQLGANGRDKRSEFYVPLQWSYTHVDLLTLRPGVPLFCDVAEIRAPHPNRLKLLTKPHPPEGYFAW
jgi:hypothetical protein